MGESNYAFEIGAAALLGESDYTFEIGAATLLGESDYTFKIGAATPIDKIENLFEIGVAVLLGESDYTFVYEAVKGHPILTPNSDHLPLYVPPHRRSPPTKTG